MPRVLAALLLAAAAVSSSPRDARAELLGEALEARDVSAVVGAPPTLKVLRFCARFSHAGDRVLNVGFSDATSAGGVPIHQTSGGDDVMPAPAAVAGNPALAWDSWVGVGDAPTGLDPDFDGVAFATGGRVAGGWYDLDPSSAVHPDATGAVCLAQVAFQVDHIPAAGLGLDGDLTLFHVSGTTGALLTASVAWAVLAPLDVVDLLELTARRREDGAVRLRWVTGHELRCGAFELLRCVGAVERCPVASHRTLAGYEAIACRGGLTGATYEAVDVTAPRDVDLSYLLREHETGGRSVDYGPVRLAAGATGGTGAPAPPPPVSDPPPDAGRSGVLGCAATTAPGGHPLAPLPFAAAGLLDVVSGGSLYAVLPGTAPGFVTLFLGRGRTPTVAWLGETLWIAWHDALTGEGIVARFDP
jgi:hypothetical protein